MRGGLSFSGPLLIEGSGSSLLDDLSELGAWSGARMAINFTGVVREVEFDHWASLHPEIFLWAPYLRGWRSDTNDEETKYLPTYSGLFHSCRTIPGVKRLNVWKLDRGGGSGLFAVLVGLSMGYEDIVLAGMPQDNSGYFFDLPPKKRSLSSSHGGKSTRRAWEMMASHYDFSKVSSLSGWTKKFLGGHNG